MSTNKIINNPKSYKIKAQELDNIKSTRTGQVLLLLLLQNKVPRKKEPHVYFTFASHFYICEAAVCILSQHLSVREESEHAPEL